MKIKDVMEQTGLTDKAIRLYINNGLVAPSIEENYSGRKSIDFSYADVERLKNIALLRKAGFSIADIKEMLSNAGDVGRIVNVFSGEKAKNIRIDMEILNAIKKISDEEFSFEKLCKALDEATTEKDVPAEDVRVSNREKILKRIFKILGIMNLLVSAGFLIFYLVSLKTENRFLNLEEQWCFILLVAYGGLAIATALSIVLIRLCSEKRVVKYSFRKICAVLISLMLILTFSVPWSFISTLTIVAAVTTSKTEKTENYLQLDEFVEKQKNEVFPDRIPVEAEEVKYYYRYCSELFEYNFDIFAEWTLPRDMFEDIVGSKIYYYENVPVSVDEESEVVYELQLKKKELVPKGNWQLIYYADSDIGREWVGEEGPYHISIFAYNEKTRTARYIISESDYGGYEPYYVSLEW